MMMAMRGVGSRRSTYRRVVPVLHAVPEGDAADVVGVVDVHAIGEVAPTSQSVFAHELSWRVLAEEVAGVAGPVVRPALVVAFPVICEALDAGEPITSGVEIGNQRRYRLGESLRHRDSVATSDVDGDHPARAVAVGVSCLDARGVVTVSIVPRFGGRCYCEQGDGK
jgi:hypothetical protein